jgi:hypothetical protein
VRHKIAQVDEIIDFISQKPESAESPRQPGSSNRKNYVFNPSIVGDGEERTRAL